MRIPGGDPGHGGARAGAGRPRQVGGGADPDSQARPLDPDTQLPVPRHGGTGQSSAAERNESPQKIVMNEIQTEIDTIIGGTGNVQITKVMMKGLAIIALGSLVHASRRGNVRASMYILDRFLGTPDKPFQDEVAAMSEEQVKARLREELTFYGMYTPGQVDQLVENAFNRAPETVEEVTDALTQSIPRR